MTLIESAMLVLIVITAAFILNETLVRFACYVMRVVLLMRLYRQARENSKRLFDAIARAGTHNGGA